MGAPKGFTALIALRAKQGEFDALTNTTDGDLWEHVQPLIDLDAGTAPATQLNRVESIARQLARLGRHIMVDASGLRSSTGFGPSGPLGSLVDRLSGPVDLLDEEFPVPIIPVVRDDASDSLAASIARLSDETGIGMALRIRAATADPPAVARLVEVATIGSRPLDVIIDRRYVDRMHPEHAERVLAILEFISGIGTVRSVAVLSGSVPSALKQTALWQQPRYEELLWREITRLGGEHVRFGDYGVVHPIPGDGHPSKHVSVKYACANGWLFSRERIAERAEAGRADTLRRACQHLVDDENFAGPRFSWGDHQLSDAARGSASGLGSTSKPIAFSTSHHLAYLASLAAA